MEVFKGERAFALLLVALAFLALLLTTTFPLGYLLYKSFFTINLSMPFLDGFAGIDNYARMLADARFWQRIVDAVKRAAVVAENEVSMAAGRHASASPRATRPDAVPDAAAVVPVAAEAAAGAAHEETGAETRSTDDTSPAPAAA